MSLSASMWTSVSGLITHGQKMSTVGNNIANINTVGFKGSRMDFQDILYSSIGTKFGGGQIGGGVGVGIIMNDFSQGSFETSTSSLDIGIQGNGFYKVAAPNGTAFYTRAGNFSLTKDGNVVDSNNYKLQGWDLSTINRGSPKDIQVDTSVCPPKHATEVKMQVNLPSKYIDNSKDTTGDNPFFALLNNWNATQATPLGQGQYAWSTTLSVYDEGGTLHNLTVYFDQVTKEDITDTTDNPDEIKWEYVITMSPGEDKRNYDGVEVPDEFKGILGTGTMTFNSSGEMINMTCFVPQYDANAKWFSTTVTPGADPLVDPDIITHALDLNGFVAAPINTDGLPVICPNFSGTKGLSNAYEETVYDQPNDDARDRLIAIDFGLSTSTNQWTFPASTVTDPAVGGLVTAASIGTDYQNTQGFDATVKKTSNTMMTSRSGSYTEYNLNQNGYSYGYLSNITVASNGIISGVYSNGQTLELYMIALYNFPSLQNLRHEGNCLYSETAASGAAVCGEPGSGQFGTTESYRLEQSNVDLSTEFVNMITTQRGFQANSKSITTVDTMLETVIGMKR